MTEPAENTSPDKLSIVVFSGAFDKVHYALVLASAAAAVDRAVTLFFTMEACRALVPGGWQALPAGEDGARTGADMDAEFGEKSVGQFEELLAACAQLGVHFIVCEMGLRAVGLEKADLRTDIAIESAGVVTFLNDASPDGLSLFI